MHLSHPQFPPPRNGANDKRLLQSAAGADQKVEGPELDQVPCGGSAEGAVCHQPRILRVPGRSTLREPVVSRGRMRLLQLLLFFKIMIHAKWRVGRVRRERWGRERRVRRGLLGGPRKMGCVPLTAHGTGKLGADGRGLRHLAWKHTQPRCRSSTSELREMEVNT